MHWYRLAIDIDAEGTTKGLSYEVRREDRIVTIHVLGMPAPNENAHDALEALIAHCEDQYGIQVPFF